MFPSTDSPKNAVDMFPRTDTLKWHSFYPLKPCGDYSVDTKDVNLEILHFKQFYKHFVFEKDEEGYVKKTQKNYMDVRVVFRLVWGNTKNIINSFCTFYKSSLKGCSFCLFCFSLHPTLKNIEPRSTRSSCRSHQSAYFWEQWIKRNNKREYRKSNQRWWKW